MAVWAWLEVWQDDTCVPCCLTIICPPVWQPLNFSFWPSSIRATVRLSPVSRWNSSNLKHKLTECKRSNSILVSKWSSLECPIIWKPLVICWRNTMLGFYHLTIWNWLHLPTDKSPSSCWLLPFFPPWDFHKFVDNNTPDQTCGAVKDNKEGGREGGWEGGEAGGCKVCHWGEGTQSK